MHEYFSLFGLVERFAIDPAQLDVPYRQVQAQVHPDRFAHRPEAERRVAMQWATLANEAFRTLKNPLARARYLLGRRGVEIDADRNNGMSHAFLMQQMEWREAVEDSMANPDALQRLERDLARDERVMLDDLKHSIDDEVDLTQASELVRRLMFMEKLRREIDEALAQLET